MTGRRAPARPGDHGASGGAPATSRQPVGVFVGLAVLDLVLGVERVPRPDEKVVARSQLVAAGGPPANAAVAFAWAGGEARLLTALGRHPLAAAAREDLEGHGVRVVDATPDRTEPPPVSAVLVTEATGERAVVSRTDRDTPAAAAPADTVAAVLAGANVVLADGHRVELAMPVVAAARAAGIPVILDAGTWRPSFELLVPLADVVVASAACRPPTAGPGVAGVLHDLLRRGTGFAAVTAGPAPIAWAAAAGTTGRLVVPAVDVVDTLGAGDILHGVLAALVARRAMAVRPAAGGSPGAIEPGFLARALAEAARIASRSCAVTGTRAWLTAGIEPPVA